MSRILVSEDDAHMLRVLSLWLQRNGHQVVEMRDGAAAREFLSGASVDLVVSDVNMPQLSGVELVEWIRTVLGSEVPIVLLSSRCDQTALSNVVKQYHVRVHAKPFSPSRLMGEIESLLGEGPAARGVNAAARGDAAQPLGKNAAAQELGGNRR